MEGFVLHPVLAGSIKLKRLWGASGMTFVLKEIAIEQALNNPICYAIQGDMLYIHYKESEGSNLFIMQRK